MGKTEIEETEKVKKISKTEEAGGMDAEIDHVLFDEATLQQRVRELGRQITEDYQGREPLFLGILKGSVVFLSDLVRCVRLHGGLDFMRASSYGGVRTVTSGQVDIFLSPKLEIAGRDLLLVEDILDSGLTLSRVRATLQVRQPASIRIVTLLDKPERRRADIHADYVGFTVPDAFVVGYGLDYDERYRNLPYIGVLRHEIYEHPHIGEQAARRSV